MPPHSSAGFPTTAWSLVRAAQTGDEQHHLEAVNRFAAAYWRPVFFFLRAKGHAADRAEDLTQEFFLRFLERAWIRRADPERGRFRTFLLTILTRFLSDRGPKRAPKQDRFEQGLVSISALVGPDERKFEPPEDETPENIFMKHWAQAVIDNVRRRLQVWCEGKGRPDWHRIFTAKHFPPAGGRGLTQQALAAEFNATRDQVRYALEQVESLFVEFLHAEVADQVGSQADIETEIRELEDLLGD